MKTNLRIIFSVFIILFLSVAPITAIAQETSSTLRVIVTGPDGAALTGASVSVTDTRNGASRNLTTSSSGTATAIGMPVGGPYTVAVKAADASGITVSDIFLRLGETYILPLALGGVTLEEVIVTASQIRRIQVALGPSTSFGLEDLQDYPAINRDIRDVIRFDPRIYQDQGFVGAIHCAGANPRFNSLTVDGVRMNDNFGLNSNGFPTARQPFPFDSIQEVTVELAPFDVFWWLHGL